MTVSTSSRHAPVCAYGKGWSTRDAAASSERGRKPGAQVFRCAVAWCPHWHIRRPSRDRLLTLAVYLEYGATPELDCPECLDLGIECPACAQLNSDRAAFGGMFWAIDWAATDEEALAVLLDGIRELAVGSARGRRGYVPQARA